MDADQTDAPGPAPEPGEADGPVEDSAREEERGAGTAIEPAAGRPSTRSGWERLGVIAGVLALVVGLGTWLLPDPGKAVCALVGYRYLGCNDIPEAYLGTWQGTVTMKAEFVSNGEQGTDAVTIRRASRGEDTAAMQRAVDWRDAQGRDVGCSDDWQLASVQPDRLVFRLVDAYFNDPATGTGLNACISDMTLTAQLKGGTLDIIAIAGSTIPLVPPGSVVWAGTLSRTGAGEQ